MSQSDGKPVIVLEGVSKVFTDQPEGLVALQDVNLTVHAGEFVSLVGPSGCGKSTLLRVIADLLPPTTGRVRVNDKSAQQARLDRDYGIVFQAPVLYDWRTVTGNIQLPLEVMGYPADQREALTREMLELVGLSEFRDSYPRQLSGGMQQRVAIARALVFRPSILLMDEPFGALDELTRERLNHELLRIWAQTGVTVVFVTHHIAEAVFLSDRVAVMTPRPGRIARVVDIQLPRPRDEVTREMPEYYWLLSQVRAALRDDRLVVGASPYGDSAAPEAR
jgi:NitT/TauT family transport system ATP-binding protein